MSAIQRKGRTGFGKGARGSVSKAQARATIDFNKQPASDLPLETPPNTNLPEGNLTDFRDVVRSRWERLLILRYRYAARQAFKSLSKAGDKRVKTVMFGHTHFPDRYMFGEDQVYINSGDWCGHTSHQCYCLVHEDGFVSGPFQWRDPGKNGRHFRELQAAGVAASTGSNP